MQEELRAIVQSEYTVGVGQILWTLLTIAVAYGINRGLLKLSALLFAQPIRWIRTMRYWIPILRVVVWFSATFTIVAVLSPPTELLFALLTASGVAIGLAAQELVKNLFGAFIIWSDRVYAEGDRVTIGDVEGIVKSIGLRSTKIWAFDDTMIVLPNSKLLSDAAFNANTGESDEQVVIDLFLPLDVEVERATELARLACLSSELLEAAKPIVVLVTDELQGDYPYTRIRIKAYVRAVTYEKVFHADVSLRAKRLFRAHGLYGEHFTK